MQRTGSKLNISNLASEMGITRQTLYSYLSFLESTYFISLISPHSKNVGREVSGTKKVYVCDTGILNHFAKVSSGGIFENAVFNTIKKIDEINYYQRISGNEIDFILKNKKIALEVKEGGTSQDKNNLNNMAKDLGIKEDYIISKSFKKDKGFICAVDV
jgi:predicted AAA+ superfamily ATPase